jgi:hypothetical protein
VYEAKLVYGFYRQRDLGHVEARDVLGEDLVLDEHGHQITTRQKLHEHVEEGVVLERRVQLDDPWTVGFGENVALGPDVGQLVFLELLCVSRVPGRSM